MFVINHKTLQAFHLFKYHLNRSQRILISSRFIYTSPCITIYLLEVNKLIFMLVILRYGHEKYINLRFAERGSHIDCGFCIANVFGYLYRLEKSIFLGKI